MPTDAPIPRGTLVTLDIGARLDGYCSDCTRTWATGELPDDLADAYALVQRAQAESLAAVRPGPPGREVDAVARRIIEDAGHGEHFGHGLGHGVGMEIHEAPRLARSAEEALVAGHVVTVEPGVYIPGRGGVRIEDLVVVTEDGHSVISTTTKDLIFDRLGRGTHSSEAGGTPISGAMELRARTRPMLRRAGLLTALTALLVPAVAGTTTASAKTNPPVVKKVTPKSVYVGEKMTVRGHHFRRGVGKNLVAFKRDGAKAVFVPAEKATTKMLDRDAAQAPGEDPGRQERHADRDASEDPRALEEVRQALHVALEVPDRQPRAPAASRRAGPGRS